MSLSCCSSDVVWPSVWKYVDQVFCPPVVVVTVIIHHTQAPETKFHLLGRTSMLSIMLESD